MLSFVKLASKRNSAVPRWAKSLRFSYFSAVIVAHGLVRLNPLAEESIAAFCIRLDVARFQVAVNDAFVMGVLDRVADVDKQLQAALRPAGDCGHFRSQLYRWTCVLCVCAGPGDKLERHTKPSRCSHRGRTQALRPAKWPWHGTYAIVVLHFGKRCWAWRDASASVLPKLERLHMLTQGRIADGHFALAGECVCMLRTESATLICQGFRTNLEHFSVPIGQIILQPNGPVVAEPNLSRYTANTFSPILSESAWRPACVALLNPAGRVKSESTWRFSTKGCGLLENQRGEQPSARNRAPGRWLGR